jgi:DNA-binding CsgD family transcriptional regulator
MARTLAAVSSRAVEASLRALAVAGVDVPPLPEGLKLDSPDTRLSWDTFAQWLERARAAVGDDRAFERIFSDVPANLPLLPELTALAPDGREMYRISAQVFVPHAFPFIEQRFEPVGDHQVVITRSLPESIQGAEAIFFAFAGTLRAVPTLVGLPPAEITSAVTPHSGRFLVTPPARWMSQHADNRPESLLMNAVLEEMLFRTREFATVLRPGGAHLAPEDRLGRAAARWHLSPRQKNVLSGIVAGLSNKEIAAQWSRAEVTVELHVSALFRKAGASSRLALLSKYYAL